MTELKPDMPIEYVPPGIPVTPVPTGITPAAGEGEPAAFAPYAAGPEIIDLTDGATTEIAPGNEGLFDDAPIRGTAPAPKPPSTHFYKLDPRLQSLDTKIVLIGAPRQPNGDRLHWDLWGPDKGRQGLMLAPNVSGLMHVPFVHLMSEGPYMVGAFPERIDWKKREIALAVMVGVGYGPDTSFRYRMLEERWWSSISATEDAFLGVFTRTHGWRWLKVRLAEEPKTPFQIDPVAHDNNFMQWDMVLVSPHPYYYKRKRISKWVNASDNGDPPPSTPWNRIDQLIRDLILGLIPNYAHLVPGVHVGEGIIRVVNAGSEPAHPLFIVSSPGRCWIEDGPGGNMTELPLLTAADGYVLIDTDPMRRTATAATDPVDPIYMRIVRNSQLLDFILHDITSSTLPVWRRMTGRFQVPWPAKQVANIRVRHSNAYGSVTCLMPQRYGMGFG